MAIILKARPSHNFFHVSVSKIKMFKNCPASYRYRYILKFPTEEKDFQIYGKFEHKVLELFHKEIINEYAGDYNKLMTNSFKKAMDDYPQMIKEQTDDAFSEMASYLSFIKKQEIDGTLPKVIAVEEEFYIDIDGDILLQGFVDRVQIDTDGTLHVGDYKTSNHKKYLQKDDFQLLTYAYAKCVEDPSIQKVRASYIMLKFDFEHITKEYSRDEIMEVEEKLLSEASEIRNEKLYRASTGPLCKYCDFLKECPEGTAFVEKKETNKKEQDRKRHQFGASDWS